MGVERGEAPGLASVDRTGANKMSDPRPADPREQRLGKLRDELKIKAYESNEEGRRINRTIHHQTDAEDRCYARAEAWVWVINQLDALLAEAPRVEPPPHETLAPCHCGPQECLHPSHLVAGFYCKVAVKGVEPSPRARIICLCGSTRFIEQFAIKTWELEREGHIVLGCTLLPSWYCDAPSHFGERTGTKAQCDELHLRKIDLADDVLVLNIGGYIGESTRNEIAYATRHGKPVTYLEAPVPAAGEEP